MSQDDATSPGSKTPTFEGRRENQPYNDGAYSSDESISPMSKSPVMAIPSPTGSTGTIRPRRSSYTLGLEQLRHAGGVNSIDAFARSWTRAAGYPGIASSRRSYVSVEDNGDEEDGFSRAGSVFGGDDDADMPNESSHLYPAWQRTEYGSFGSIARGTMPTEGLRGSVIRHAEDLLAEQEAAILTNEHVDKEREPLLVKTVETEEGHVQRVIVGQSTMPQTVFNSVNVLIGIGLLSLPLGLRYTGWLIGFFFLTYSAVITNYTAKILARCLERSPNQALVTYSDIAFLAYGHTARVLVSILFTVELVAACVALEILFADSLHTLIPSISVLEWKIIAGFILTPLSFLPLRILSFTSVIGILSTVSIFLIVVVNGLFKTSGPGSLIDPMPQHLFPENWAMIPIGFGLLMAPWGGHGVFPNIFKDMRHPHKYPRAVNITYWFTYIIDAGMMAVGILMFGDGVLDEITSNFLRMTGYPKAAKVALICFIAVIPISKTPLNARPIINTLEHICQIESRTPTAEGMFRIAIRIFTNIVFVLVAILFPTFDALMAFMGSALCFTICVILPVLFYLKIFGNEVGNVERWFCWFLVITSSILGTVGTAWSFLPKDILTAA